MLRKLLLASCFTATISLWSQAPSDVVHFPGLVAIIDTLAGDLAVSHVYVSNTPVNSSSNFINEYSVGIDGRLIPIDGSPYYADETDITVANNQLLGIDRAVPSIDAFSIGDDGALTYQTSTDYAQFNPSDCGAANWVFPDRTAANLYVMEFLGDCSNNTYQSFAIQTSGSVTDLGVANGGAGSFSGVYLPAAFLGNNLYAYEATNDDCMYYSVWSFQRAASGQLTLSNASTALPAPPENYRIYIPTYLGTDGTNHVAIALWAANPPGCSTASQQIGAFTADGNGNLTTTNTSATMPTVAVSAVNDLKISPAGDLLAVGGTGGMQVFHFNGADPVTAYTGLLTTDSISEIFWDKANHLFALSPATNKLHVFNVTGAIAAEAPGSPYAINQPIRLAVQSR